MNFIESFLYNLQNELTKLAITKLLSENLYLRLEIVLSIIKKICRSLTLTKSRLSYFIKNNNYFF